MPAALLVQWMQYSEVEPWDEVRDDLRSGQIAALLYNTHRKADARPLGARDFVLYDPDRPVEVDPASIYGDDLDDEE